MRTRRRTAVISGVVVLTVAVQCMAVQEVPALKDVFKDDFLIGGALNRRVIAGRDTPAAAIAEKHFSTATSENDLKWQLIHPWPDQYNWESADSYVDFCDKNHMAAVGHCLVWHSQTPRWVFREDSQNTLPRDALLARMKDTLRLSSAATKAASKGGMW